MIFVTDFNLDEWVCPYCGCLNYNLQKCVRCHEKKTSVDVLQNTILKEIQEIQQIKLEIREKITRLVEEIEGAKNDANYLITELKNLQKEYKILAEKEQNLTFQKVFQKPVKVIAENQKTLFS